MTAEAWIKASANVATVVGGMVMLSMAYGWKTGVGIGLLVWFHKNTEEV